MKVIDARFVTSAVTAAGIPNDGVPHVALVGRSNVGKSTLINALVRRPLARTSAAPGKTRLANLYLATVAGGAGAPGQWRVYFADLPGYGYARGGEPSVAELGRVAAEYFSADRIRMAGVLHLVDARHPGLEADVDAHRWIETLGVAHALVAAKIDKLSRAERARNLTDLERTFGTAALPVSAARGEGLDDLWSLIARLART
ncbi:MAG TPA: ribosome biogenesis GTP-binding protein YihA/YsxC [Vicinamibacterales bacterium]|nr:ribosome biogenesis GTP-binding protein YihA/YsxC [Vicinamibacterales bacterium]